MFRRHIEPTLNSNRLAEFSYLGSNHIYMDSSCQSLRPLPVIEAMDEYYKTYGACSGRVKYEWGQKVDSIVEETRQLVVDYLDLPKKDYICSFTLNTTYGLNLILSQLPIGKYKRIVTSEIEHNSVFLPTITHAKRLSVERIVLPRARDGGLIYDKTDLNHSIVVVNTTSNIDGRLLTNLAQLIKDAHESDGIVILDAAQTVAHHRELLRGCQADAICFSAHKTYAASLGVVVIKKDLLRTLEISFIGGGMVNGVKQQSYQMYPDDMAAWLEPGLQPYAEIISLNSSIKWLKNIKSGEQHLNELARQLFDGLSNIPEIEIINSEPSSIISIYSKKVDAHRLATFLSASDIMVRSGYFCCHYYLIEKLKLPPLLRFSIGLHTTQDDVTKTIETLKKLVRS
jgi:selenocysteine lyase/cysteine desulfurase